MVGWDFGALGDRLVSDDPPWDFEAECLAAMGNARRVLDLGAGGGERLSSLCARLLPSGDRFITATEGWTPNLPVASRALRPLGIPVIPYDAESDASLPFYDGSFDLVMSRHDAFDASEVARVLAPGGLFLTQQVDGRDAAELRQWFGGDSLYPHVRLDECRLDLARAGLLVGRADEWSGTMRFRDVETLVQYLSLVPWSVPDFQVDDHVAVLTRLAAWASIAVSQRRFWLVAHKPSR